MDNAYIIDSFALIAHLEGEIKGEKVTKLLNRALSGKIKLYMSLVNFGEVYYITARERGSEKAGEILLLIEQLPLKIMDIDKDMTLEAAKIKAKHHIAYADCFAAALSKRMNLKLVTGDPEFKKLENECRILWI